MTDDKPPPPLIIQAKKSQQNRVSQTSPHRERNPGRAATDLSPLPPGGIIDDRYRLGEIYAREGSCVTFLARDERDRVDVHLVTAAGTHETASDAFIVSRMLEGLARLATSPLLLSGHLVGVGTATPAFVTTVPLGKPLAAIAAETKEPFAWRQCLQVLRSLTAACEELDRIQSVTWRFAPEHVWLDESGQTTLMGLEHAATVGVVIGGWAGPAHAPPETRQLLRTLPGDPLYRPAEVLQTVHAGWVAEGASRRVNWYGLARVLTWMILGGDFADTPTQIGAATLLSAKPECPPELAEALAGLHSPSLSDHDRAIATLSGHFPTPQARAAAPAGTSPDNPLTPRETEVLQLLTLGRTNSEISHQLTISHHTVDRHVQNLYRKLGVKRRVDASRIAIGDGLVDQNVDLSSVSRSDPGELV